MKLETLPAHMLYRLADARDVDRAKAAELAESIREIGLLSPIVVRPDKVIRNGRKVDGWRILAGNHRFEAIFRILNWTEVPCIVTDLDGLKAELAMIDENLKRSELSDALRAWQTARRKEIYEALHPETKHGSAPGAPGGGKKRRESRQIGDLERFSTATSRATGRSERSVQREAERGEKLGPVLNRIAKTSLDKGVEIDALAALPPNEREDLVARAEKGERVSARKQEPGGEAVFHPQKPSVVLLDTEEMQAVTAARRAFREYTELSRRGRVLFDELYAEVKAQEVSG